MPFSGELSQDEIHRLKEILSHLEASARTVRDLINDLEAKPLQEWKREPALIE